MRLITKIETINGKKGVKVFIDGEFYGLLYSNEIRRLKLKEDHPVEDLTLKEVDQILYKRAFQKAMSYLVNSEQSRCMIRTKLKNKDFSDSTIEKVLDRLVELGYQDDYRYACAYVMYHCTRKSVYEMRQYLKTKGVSDDIIQNALDENDVDEDKTLYELLEKKMSHMTDFHDEKQRNRVFNYALRRGYSYQKIKRYYSRIMDKKTDCFLDIK